MPKATPVQMLPPMRTNGQSGRAPDSLGQNASARQIPKITTSGAAAASTNAVAVWLAWCAL